MCVCVCVSTVRIDWIFAPLHFTALDSVCDFRKQISTEQASNFGCVESRSDVRKEEKTHLNTFGRFLSKRCPVTESANFALLPPTLFVYVQQHR